MTLVRVNGYWPEQNDFIICEPACPPWPPGAVLSRLDFDFCPVLGFSPGGELQIDCCLDGSFDGSGRRRLRLGTIKTVCTGHDTCLMMGLLTSALLYYGEIHRANLAQTSPGKDQRGPRVVRKERKENENGVFILRMQPAHGRKP